MKTSPPDKAIVTITNDSFWSARDIILISDDRCVVIYRVNVRTMTGEEKHLVVGAQSHSINQEEFDSVRRNLRESNIDAIISFYVASREGWAQVITAPDEEFTPFNLAAAISVIITSCGWDESLSIAVKINNDEVRVWPRFDGQKWVVEDREESFTSSRNLREKR
ncbi:MAG TPA: hypothetical protein VJ810_15040 [Blastocatellia bacterium]|nr:hypothetical protein [Blastocatellia bacterium]